jgi:hypothetical protein
MSQEAPPDNGGGQLWRSTGVVVRPAISDCHIAVLGDAGLAHSPPECGHLVRGCFRRPGKETTGPLLRTLRRRPCGRAADERDEVAATDHSIISSARAGISAVPKE